MSSIVKAKHNYIYQGSDEAGDEGNQPGSLLTEIDREKKSIINDAVRKSKDIKEQAEKTAASIIESALGESNAIKFRVEQQGYKDGYSKGLMDGASEARKEAEAGLEEVRVLLEAIRNERAEAFYGHEKEILLIAFEMTKKILRQQIQENEDVLITMLEDILHEYEHENDAMVKISMPEYLKSIDISIDKKIAQKIRGKINNAKVSMTKTDDSIMIETESGVIDASIAVQLEQLKQAINL